MKRTVYRGISFKEAEEVVKNQKYNRSELRDFQNGVAAKSLFGPGIYLINDVELAAHYAFCHAEVEEEELAVVLKQTVQFHNPFIVNYTYSERQLKKDALSWKFTDDFPELHSGPDSLETLKWVGTIIKEYLLNHGYDGITYHIDDEIIYYVSYHHEQQITGIDFDFVFNINEVKKQSV
ncbi:hypothetical protein M3212_04815 [Alkalihalobacillus oceani]|uniref:hypothetical protein n=1 Tax=Halalkalibacter oceani TaxID=1653776 RepID=UPI00203E36EF|nr:hypothetical protein [Halalkalibacter oceani]MCM3760110.1 hypothetical protein [Halalkalibacter oceani]